MLMEASVSLGGGGSLASKVRFFSWLSRDSRGFPWFSRVSFMAF